MVLPGVGVVPLAVPPPAHDPQQMEHAQYPVTRNLPRYVPLEELLLSVLSCAEALAPEPDVLELLLELWLLCVLYRREPVGNHQNSFILGQPLKGKLYLMFVLGVCKCCGFVKHDNRSIF